MLFMHPMNADEDCGPTDVAVTTNSSGPIIRGATLTLQCSAVDPTKSCLSFQWLKDGHVLSMATSPSLVLSAVEEEDAGVYTCRVSNRVGEGGANVTVIVISEDWSRDGARDCLNGLHAGTGAQ